MLPPNKKTNFDLPGHWDPQTWQKHNADQERARLAAEWLLPSAASILDVGCGNGVFTNRPNQSRHIVGLDFSQAALVNVSAPHVQADAAQIPFENNSFDASVCMELLEHLTPSTYQRVLDELTRVARKYILISVPYNEDLKYSIVICPICRSAFHPYHHVRRFDRLTLANLFEPRFHLERIESILAARRDVFPAVWHLVSLYQHRGGRNYPSGIVCPQCGYFVENLPPVAGRITSAREIRRAFHHYWPKRSTFIWWMAMYQKDSAE